MAAGVFYSASVLFCVLPAILTDTGQVVNKDSEFVRLFSKCHRSSPKFDRCMVQALNNARPFFKYGVPELNIKPFDPFFAEEIVQTRGFPGLNYRLRLRNVYESGWTSSKVTRFKSDFTNGVIKYHQSFPEKYVEGRWDTNANVLAPWSSGGQFLISLYNYTQVTTIRLKDRSEAVPGRKFSVRVEAVDCENMKVDVKNLLNGRTALEAMLDRIINLTWRPGFRMIKPLLNELVSTAFDKIFNEDFSDFPFTQVIPD